MSTSIFSVFGPVPAVGNVTLCERNGQMLSKSSGVTAVAAQVS